MCRYRSGEACYDPNSHAVTVKMLDGEDSHTKIREQHGIRESSSSLMDRYHTPVEYVPTKDLDRTTWDGWTLIWDAEKPEWADDEIIQDIVRQMRERVMLDDLAHWGGDLVLDGLKSIPKGVILSAGGVTLREGGYINLPGRTVKL